jgi:hypothetical protein
MSRIYCLVKKENASVLMSHVTTAFDYNKQGSEISKKPIGRRALYPICFGNLTSL